MADNSSQPQAADTNTPAVTDPSTEAPASNPNSEAQTSTTEDAVDSTSDATDLASTETKAEVGDTTTPTAETSNEAAESPTETPAGDTPTTEPDGAASSTEDTNTPKAEEGAPPPPPAPNSDQSPPPSEKKNKLLKILIPIIVVLILGGIGGGVSYYLGFWGKKPVESVEIVQADGTSEATDSASADPVLITPDCVSGYKPYVNKLFSICYPITMDIKELPATESGIAVTEFIFEDDVEILRVLTDYKDNLNKFDCASSKVVKVATYSAHRYQVKDPNPKGGCAGTINEYASLVSAGNDKPIFYIGLTRKQGSYQSDNGAFAAIEQSFRINQP